MDLGHDPLDAVKQHFSELAEDLRSMDRSHSQEVAVSEVGYAFPLPSHLVAVHTLLCLCH